MKFSDYKLFSSKLDLIDFSNVKIINTINAHSYCVAVDDKEFKNALINSDILLPDGVGIVWAEKFINSKKIKKIAGYDIFVFLMNKMNKIGGSVFFLGSSCENLNKIKIKSSIEFPNIKIGTYSPPFNDSFSCEESKIMCQKVNDFSPDILFVGMTAPKQEKWTFQFKNKINADIICSIGAVFDFYSGNIKRAPKFIIKNNLEWFYRAFNSFRLFKRYFFSVPKFIFYIFFYR